MHNFRKNGSYRNPELKSQDVGPVLGKIKHASLFQAECSDVLIAISKNSLRLELVHQLSNRFATVKM